MGGGLLYVQPVYTQSSTGTQVPLLHRVLVAFGEEVGFASTLDEALDQVFGGNSGADTGDEGTRPPTDGDEDLSTAEEKLRDALERAAQAIKDSSEAMTAGNWTAYGNAQDDLDQALQDAIAAEAEISGEAPVGEEEVDELPLDDATDLPLDDETEDTEG